MDITRAGGDSIPAGLLAFLPAGVDKTDWEPADNGVGLIADSPDLAAVLAPFALPATNWVKKKEFSQVSAVSYFNGLYIAAGYSAADGDSSTYRYGYTSVDGNNFTRLAGTAAQMTTGNQGNPIDLAVSPAAAICVYQGGVVSRSTDGKNWAQIATDIQSQIRTSSGIANYAITIYKARLVNGEFWVMGSRSGTGIATANFMASSADGITWTDRSGVANTTIRNMVYGNGIYVAFGDSGFVQTSPDKAAWTVRAVMNPPNGSAPGTAMTTQLLVGVWDGVRFVIIGLNGRMLTSPDGINWTVTVLDDAISTPYRLLFAFGVYILVTGSNALDGRKRIMVSSDLVTWRQELVNNQGLVNLVTDVFFGNNRFIAVVTSATAGFFTSGVSNGIIMTDVPPINPATQYFRPFAQSPSALLSGWYHK